MNEKNKQFKLMQKMFEKTKYEPYYDNKYLMSMPPRCGKSIFQQVLNCSDEVVPGSKKRQQKIRELMNQKIKMDENFTEKYARIVYELHQLFVEEHMSLTNSSKLKANQFIAEHLNLYHVKKYIIDGEVYLSANPIFEY